MYLGGKKGPAKGRGMESRDTWKGVNAFLTKRVTVTFNHRLEVLSEATLSCQFGFDRYVGCTVTSLVMPVMSDIVPGGA